MTEAITWFQRYNPLIHQYAKNILLIFCTGELLHIIITNFDEQQFFSYLDIIINPENFNPKIYNKNYHFARLPKVNIKADFTA